MVLLLDKTYIPSSCTRVAHVADSPVNLAKICLRINMRTMEGLAYEESGTHQRATLSQQLPDILIMYCFPVTGKYNIKAE